MVFAAISVYFTYKITQTKFGVDVRGQAQWVDSVYSDEKYVSSIKLQNFKDKSIAIFSIYVRIGHNYYIEIEEFEDSPLILNPFETINRNYDPIEFYNFNSCKIRISSLPSKLIYSSELILYTSEGRYNVRKRIPNDNLVMHYFNNHLTAIAKPIRLPFKGVSYGGNTKFIVEFIYENGKSEVVPLQEEDYSWQKFKRFSLSKDALRSKDDLERFLEDKISNSLLTCASFTVYDLNEKRKEIFEGTYKEHLARQVNWFEYYILGKILTTVAEFRLKLKNRKAREIANKNNISRIAAIKLRSIFRSITQATDRSRRLFMTKIRSFFEALSDQSKN